MTAARATVLLVDDEPEILVALEDLLGDDYRVLSTTSPIEALDILAREPDVATIVSDQRMPELTGDQFLARARGGANDSEAILLTGYADLSAVIGALNAGGIIGYSPKPWDPDALRGMVADAVRRHTLARDLATERRLLHGLLDSSRDAVSFKDADGRFVRLNRAKAAELGADVAACLGRTERELGDPARADAVERADRAAIAARAAAGVTEERAGRDGAMRWYAVERLPIGGDGDAYLVTTERDVTVERAMEERLRQSDKLQALGTLAGGVAHDFNNLLTAVIGNLDLAARRLGDGDPALARLIGNATEAGQRGAALTHRLLSFSRQRDLNARVVDPAELVRGMDDLLERTLGGMIAIDYDLADDGWTVRVDPNQLELAVLNLCINARDAMPEGGTLTIAARAHVTADGEVAGLGAGEHVAISVRDTGTGIPPAVLARVFEPFFTTKEVGKGTGLGLSMVYGLAQQAGGAVKIDSAPGEGTTVALYLPRSADAACEAGPSDAVETSRTPLRVLLVDDDPEVQEVTAGYLSALGHAAVKAHDGASALAALEAGAVVDVVVADFAMPGMTGAELALEVRARWPALPFLLITGYAEFDGDIDLVHILGKPFRADDLGRAIGDAVAG